MNNHAPIKARATTAIATPTPIPAFAPVERLPGVGVKVEEGELVGAGLDGTDEGVVGEVEDGDAVTVVLTRSVTWNRIDTPYAFTHPPIKAVTVALTLLLLSTTVTAYDAATFEVHRMVVVVLCVP